jgi:hypothetical protein
VRILRGELPDWVGHRQHPLHQYHRRAGAGHPAGPGDLEHLPHHGGRRRHRHGPGRL